MPKKPIFGECAKMFSCRLYSWEKELVKAYIKKIREKKKLQLKKRKTKCAH